MEHDCLHTKQTTITAIKQLWVDAHWKPNSPKLKSWNVKAYSHPLGALYSRNFTEFTQSRSTGLTMRSTKGHVEVVSVDIGRRTSFSKPHWNAADSYCPKRPNNALRVQLKSLKTGPSISWAVCLLCVVRIRLGKKRKKINGLLAPFIHYEVENYFNFIHILFHFDYFGIQFRFIECVAGKTPQCACKVVLYLMPGSGKMPVLFPLCLSIPPCDSLCDFSLCFISVHSRPLMSVIHCLTDKQQVRRPAAKDVSNIYTHT